MRFLKTINNSFILIIAAIALKSRKMFNRTENGMSYPFSSETIFQHFKQNDILLFIAIISYS